MKIPIAIRLFWESLRFGMAALRENILRTVLSLLGVTIGIFAIIGVLTFVDALERGIKDSLSFLGEKVIYVQRMPWIFEPDYPWWKYFSRPNPTIEEYEFLRKRLTKASAVSVFTVRGGFTIKYKENSVSGLAVQGITHSHAEVADIPVEEGRYFTLPEADYSAEVVILGHTLAAELFGLENPIGKFVKLRGEKFKVIGILKKQGENLLDAPSNDNICIIPYFTYVKKFASKRGVFPTIAAKGFENDTDLQDLEGEMRGLLRSYRGIGAKQEDSFALNRPEMFAKFLDGIIAVLTLAGAVIGSFSILVGGFGIANIMFVSVKERTNLIGIQKSLGARNEFILFQFLFEAIFLSVIGGFFGLILVSLLSFLSTDTFVIVINYGNILLGLVIALLIGLSAGVIPAWIAARLDPVEAIRSK
ncbi:ABC transporter permease [Hugenholtzia roseola]|uniref:ABC transporter permease n=1 Tax=Hugenholtzia roseola TaxID=1002 RepID=UPI0003F7FF0B|nr:ABC transporter permease [Hugenholtzia roseola]